MRRTKHKLTCLGLGFLLIWSASGVEATANTEPSVTHQLIEQSWQKREKAVRTFKISWDEDYTIQRGSYLSGKSDARKNPGGKVVPEEQVTLKTSYTLTMDGDRMRYKADQVWLSPNQDLTRQPSVFVSTKEGSKRLLEPGTTPYPRGVISADRFDQADINDPVLFPILVAFRPNSPLIDRFNDFTKRFEILPGLVSIEGRECVKVKEIVTNSSQPITTAWLDPEREFALVRLTRSREGKLMSQFSFHEFRRTDVGWVPIRWTTTFLTSEEEVDTSQTAIVREFEVNKPVPDSEFVLAFPEGTWVTDVRGGEENSYIVKPGGEHRKVLVDELVSQATYEQLLNSNTGEALHKPMGRRWSIWLGIAGIVALLAVVGYLAHRRKHLQRTSKAHQTSDSV